MAQALGLFVFWDGKPLSHQRLVLVVQSVLHSASVLGSYSGHSFWIGGRGEGEKGHLIKMLRHWSSDTYKIYIQTPTSKVAQVSNQLLWQVWFGASGFGGWAVAVQPLPPLLQVGPNLEIPSDWRGACGWAVVSDSYVGSLPSWGWGRSASVGFSPGHLPLHFQC